MCSSSAELYRVHWAHPAGCKVPHGGRPWSALGQSQPVPAGSSTSVSTLSPAKPPPFRGAHGDPTSLRKSGSCDRQEKWWRRCCRRHGEGDIVGAWLETHFWKGVTHIRAGIPLRDCSPWATHAGAEGTRRKEQRRSRRKGSEARSGKNKPLHTETDLLHCRSVALAGGVGRTEQRWKQGELWLGRGKERCWTEAERGRKAFP